MVLLLLSISLLAADPPLPTLRVSMTSDGPVVWLKNIYSQPLSAFTIEAHSYDASGKSKTNVMAMDLIPVELSGNSERRLTIPAASVGAVAENGKITSAIYADKTTAGEADKIKILREAGGGRLSVVREIVARIDAAIAAGKDKDWILADLKAWSDSLTTAPAAPPALDSRTKAGIRRQVPISVKQIEARGVDAELANLKKIQSLLEQR
jgi:hypothetical protein